MRSLTLRDGRQLAWREYGKQGGYPVVFMHGNLNSRLLQPAWSQTDRIAIEAGARIFAVDRPGYGRSDFLVGRTYRSWAEDVAELAKACGLDELGVLGFSSGGPNAMVCALEKPDLVKACGLLSSDGPYTEMDQNIVKHMYGVSGRGLSWDEASARKTRVVAEMRTQYEQVQSEGKRESLLADLKEATVQGLDAAIQDNVLETSKWDFDIGAFETLEPKSRLLLWHGDKDADVPFAVGEYLASQFPSNCRVSFIEGENHSLLRRHWGAILQSVVSAAVTNDREPERSEL